MGLGVMDRWRDGRTDKRKSPYVLQDFVPFKAAAQKRKLGQTNQRNGKWADKAGCRVAKQATKKKRKYRKRRRKPSYGAADAVDAVDVVAAVDAVDAVAAVARRDSHEAEKEMQRRTGMQKMKMLKRKRKRECQLWWVSATALR